MTQPCRPTAPGSFLRLEHLTDLELARGAALAGIYQGQRLEREPLGSFGGLVHRLHLKDPKPATTWLWSETAWIRAAPTWAALALYLVALVTL